MKSIEKLQNLLPIGYLFLVLMGILKESLLYYQLGVNILKYSTITDILISPIADLASNPILLVFVIILFVFPLALTGYLAKRSNNKWIQKISGLKKTDGELTPEEIKSHFTKAAITFFVVGILSFFLGIGIGKGHSIAERITNNKLDYSYQMNFNTGESENTYIIGSNSVYYFYLTKGKKTIKIAPVGVIKNIEILNNRMLK